MRWRGFKCLDRHLCLACHPSPDSVGAPPMRIFPCASVSFRIGFNPPHTHGGCLLPGGGRQPTLCLPGPPLGGSEGIGFPSGARKSVIY